MHSLPRTARLAAGCLLLLLPATLAAQSYPGQQPAPSPSGPVRIEESVVVVGATPLPGVDVPVSQVPAPVQTATDRAIAASGALDLSDLLNRRLNGVHVNEMQNNPFQPDLNYRGYTASPLLGTPQGISVYLDGVRLNQPFGDVVSWDLIPRIAIGSTTLMPGSNPVFGLNTLGGALSVQTKDGRRSPGTTVQATYGSNARAALESEHGGQRSSGGFHWYVAGMVFGEDGWRESSPSDVRQIFGKLGRSTRRTDVTVSIGHSDNGLTGNGLQEFRLLERNSASIYTKPDTTDNRATLANGFIQRAWTDNVSFQGNVYYRDIRTGTLNGDINEESLDQSVYQPGGAERAALAAAGYGSVPASGLDATNTPFPFLRCIGNVLLNDEPAEKCNGLINRGRTAQHNGGFSGQVTHTRAVGQGMNRLTAGLAFDASTADFAQSTELGYLNADRSVTGTGAFGDGVTGGDKDGVPYDVRVDLNGVTRTFSAFAMNTLPVGGKAHVTLSGRFNRTSVTNRDRILPAGGPAHLNGEHVFTRFNPAAGVTVDVTPGVNLYAGYSEGSRAATSIELGCANPERPCKLPNAMAGDPPLDQVVTRSIDAGLRGARGRVTWHGGVFHAQNSDDILFVASEQMGFGYFRNVDGTRRQGAEVGARVQAGRLGLGAEYTFLSATFRSEETVNGESNSANEEAVRGKPGLEGSIEVEPGDQIPLIPRHMMKAFADVQVHPRVDVHLNVIGTGNSFARGNEHNDHAVAPPYYVGEGMADGYAIVNLGVRVGVTSGLDVIAQFNNLFDRRYVTAAQLGPTGFTESGRFIARPFPAIGGEFPVTRSTFVAPGAPLRAWFGLRARF
jgi:outer membrane receptor protein involved in Fe transport